ncbi:hypothetical protein [Bacillus sp. MMSF_3353]
MPVLSLDKHQLHKTSFGKYKKKFLLEVAGSQPEYLS